MLLAVPVAIGTPSALDVTTRDELGATTPCKLFRGRVVARHQQERFSFFVRDSPRLEGAVDHLGAAAADNPPVSVIGIENRWVAFAEVERRRGLPRVVEATDRFEFVRAVVGDERAEDAAWSDRAELMRIADEDDLRAVLLRETRAASRGRRSAPFRPRRGPSRSGGRG